MRRPNKSAVLGLTLLGLPLLSSVATAQGASYTAAGGAKAHFDYRVTLIPVSGDLGDLSAQASFDPQNLAGASAIITVKLDDLKTGIALRDRHAREALGADQFPNVVFTLKQLSGARSLPEGQIVSATASGLISLKGVERPLTAPIKLTRRGENVEVRTQFKVQPKDHGVVVTGADQTTTLDVSFVLKPQGG